MRLHAADRHTRRLVYLLHGRLEVDGDTPARPSVSTPGGGGSSGVDLKRRPVRGEVYF